MVEGFYQVEYQGVDSAGAAVLMVHSGKVVGVDTTGGMYYGSYSRVGGTEFNNVNVTVTLPEGAISVMGKAAPAGGLSFKVECQLPDNPHSQIVNLDTEYGRVQAKFSFVKALGP